MLEARRKACVIINIIFKECIYLVAGCDYDEYTCDNGNCEPLGYRCDGYNDCGDNSDEEYCSSM